MKVLFTAATPELESEPSNLQSRAMARRKAAFGPFLAELALKALSAATSSALDFSGPDSEHATKSATADIRAAARRGFIVGSWPTVPAFEFDRKSELGWSRSFWRRNLDFPPRAGGSPRVPLSPNSSPWSSVRLGAGSTVRRRDRCRAKNKHPHGSSEIVAQGVGTRQVVKKAREDRPFLETEPGVQALEAFAGELRIDVLPEDDEGAGAGDSRTVGNRASSSEVALDQVRGVEGLGRQGGERGRKAPRRAFVRNAR